MSKAEAIERKQYGIFAPNGTICAIQSNGFLKKIGPPTKATQQPYFMFGDAGKNDCLEQIEQANAELERCGIPNHMYKYSLAERTITKVTSEWRRV